MKENYSWTIRWLRLGWRGFIADDLRDKPTRDDCTDGIIILLVGKPNGALDFFFEDSVVETENNEKNKIMEDIDEYIYWKIFVDHVLLIEMN